MPGNPAPVTRARRHLRRTFGLIAAAAIALPLLELRALAESPSAPVTVLAQIMTRVLPFERGFAKRHPATVLVIIAEKSGNADSSSATLQMMRALQDIGSVGDAPLKGQVVAYSGPAALAAECSKRSASVLYLTPGLSGEVKGIAAALVGSTVLSVASMKDDVPQGAVLGVDVAAGKPRMSINLAQARAQKLDFPASLLNLARIF